MYYFLCDYNKNMQKNTKQLGRPKKPAHQKLEVRSIRFNSEQWAKIDAAGLDSLRHLIDAWDVKDSLYIPGLNAEALRRCK